MPTKLNVMVRNRKALSRWSFLAFKSMLYGQNPKV